MIGLQRLLLLLPLLAACSGPPESPEQRIRELIRQGEEAAEARKRDFFDEAVSAAYKDAAGRTRRDILRMLTGHFLRNRSIHLLVRIDDVQLQDQERAQAVIYAGMAASPVEGFQQLLALRASVYRIELSLVLDDPIQVVGAVWRQVQPEEIVPGL